jgi:excisionase family DNA binding protein
MSTNLKKNSLDLSEWISQAEAARLRGVSRQAIAKLVKKGRLKSLAIGGHSFVNRDEIISFEPLQAGRRKTNGEE